MRAVFDEVVFGETVLRYSILRKPERRTLQIKIRFMETAESPIQNRRTSTWRCAATRSFTAPFINRFMRR